MRAWRYTCGMGKTSVYLSDELDAAWKASGVPLAELVRDGLEARSAATAGISGARLVILAALDEYAARHASDTAGIPRTVADTAEIPSSDTADIPQAAAPSPGRKAAREPRAPRPPAPPPPDVIEEAIVPIERSARKGSCSHASMRVRKGVCPDCREWVSGGRK